jgi:hypothetical protein
MRRGRRARKRAFRCRPERWRGGCPASPLEAASTMPEPTTATIVKAKGKPGFMGVLQFSIAARSAKPFQLSQDHVGDAPARNRQLRRRLQMKLSSCCRIVKKSAWGRDPALMHMAPKWALMKDGPGHAADDGGKAADFGDSYGRARPRSLSKQRFQRAFMPQCDRLHAMGVCDLEPTDPPPQVTEEEMKGAPIGRSPSTAF